MTSERPFQERVDEYLERHPDATVATIAGALGAAPSEIRAVLEGDTPAPSADETDDVDEDLPSFETEPDVFPENLLGRRMWMPWQRVDGRKIPSAVYADTDEPMSYPNPDNWRDFDTVGMACVDPRLEGPSVVLQHAEDPYGDEADPFFVVDYDDVRDPETGEVHPVVAECFERAATYGDVSTSGTGGHLIGKGALPEDVKTIQATLPDLDAFPDAEIEVYDGKRFVAMTGDHVVDTPTVATNSQDFLDELVDEFVTEEERSTPRPDAEEWEPEYDESELEEMDSTDDLQAVYDACQGVRPRDIRLRSSLTEERADGTLSFDPSWETSRSGTRLGWSPDIGWIYRRGDVGLDALQVVALEERIISSPHDYPEGADWWAAVDALRERGAHIPEVDADDDRDGAAGEQQHPLLEAALEDGADVDAEPTSALPLEQLDALPHDERRRAAKRRGVDWPTTDEARDQLAETIHDVMRHEDDRVIDAPTSLGKTHTIAATRWGALSEVTGERPVVHLLETTDARDEAIETAEEDGGAYHVLLGRYEACPVAAGDYDPRQTAEDDDRDPVTIDGEPASAWLDRQCEGTGIPFSVAHRRLEVYSDQDRDLPCCEGGECRAVRQWDVYREGPADMDYWPLVIATHNFAYAPGLRMHNNVVVDEQPDYEQDLTTGRIRDAIGAYLREIDAPVSTWEAFIQLSRHEGYDTDAATERDVLQNALDAEPDREWYFEESDAHVLAPALARAIFNAEECENDRRAGRTRHEPPRLEAGAHDDDHWNSEWVSVVMDDRNEITTVRVAPDFQAARSVVGLDAHPALPLWQQNTLPWIKPKNVLEPEERQLWRRYERGLRVVQVGDATRPLSGDDALEWLNERQLRALFDHLRQAYGADWRTVITTAQVEDRVVELMEEAGINTPESMHFGEEKSRNDFANEEIGLVTGCMDPGDDYVLDLIAERGLEAEPETAVDDDGDEYRARGRGFEGPDAEIAREILASVRENHIAQAAGRYARNPTEPTSTATVFVRTDAMPPGFADVEVPGVIWSFTDLQRDILDELRSSDQSLTAREIAESVSCSKEHVRNTLERLADVDDDRAPAVQLLEGEGRDGATLYSENGTPHSGVVDFDESPTAPYGTTSRWLLAIRPPSVVDPPSRRRRSSRSSDQSALWEYGSTTDGGDPPP